MLRPTTLTILTAALGAAALGTAAAGQGRLQMGKMWTFESPPLTYLEKAYGFKPDRKWLDSLRLASLRFGNGCSASFVSTQGLIMTNHHCARDKISEAQGKNDWIRSGFYARTAAEEVRLPGLTVQQLILTEDVTEAVTAGVTEGDDDATIGKKVAANKKRVIADARVRHPGLLPQVIAMHQGVVYQLYAYKVYDDIRLVCSPHLQISHFGGDPDNFTYPRYALDFTFCRAYGEDGRPLDTSRHYFRWSPSGPRKGELAFVTGNPGSTGRLLTKGQMSFLRDAQYPLLVEQFTDELRIVREAAAKDRDYEKRVRTFVLGRENRQKAIKGYIDGLLDPRNTEAKDRAEAEFRKKVESDPKLRERCGGAFEELERINQRKIRLQPILTFYTKSYSGVLGRALALARATDPTAEPRDRADAAREARTPIRSSEVGDKLFAAHLRRAVKWLGRDDPALHLLLGDRTPEEAVAAVKKSPLRHDQEVNELLKGERAALESSSDPVVRAALLMHEARRRAADEMNALTLRETRLGTEIGRAMFAVFGNDVSPDATYSLRFSDGVVKGFPYNGTIAPYRTTFFGLYARNREFDNRYPFDLPPIWLERMDRIDMGKGVNFVATNDIIVGNSGSPIVNRDQEIIGLIFDGNIEMLGNRFVYKDDVPRSVSVHSEAILEALAKIYDAGRIVDEIRSGSK